MAAMFTQWIGIAERIATALERIAAALEARSPREPAPEQEVSSGR